MLEVSPAALVCSAACGADLLGLEAASELGVRRRIVLPFAAERFRETSVLDRPGTWGELYDHVIAEASAKGELVELREIGGDDDAYAAASESILDHAIRLAGTPSQVIAVLIWEGKSRGKDDLTLRFADSARRRRLPIREILTVEPLATT